MSKMIQANSTNYKKGRTGKIEYIVIHYTSNNGDTAKDNCNYFKNNAKLKTSAHYFVDKNGYEQSVADSDTAYHCGTTGTYRHQYCRNANSLGVELCSLINENSYYFDRATVANAVKLVKNLMEKYSVGIQNVLRHYDVTGKQCPKPFVDNEQDWDNFKNELKKDKNMQELTKINDIAYELKIRGVVGDTGNLIKEVEKQPNGTLYWVCRKTVKYIQEKGE